MKVVKAPVAGSILPTAGPPKPSLTNQTRPSAPPVIATIEPVTGVVLNSVMHAGRRDLAEHRVEPSLLRSANQRLPSGPLVIDVAGACSGPYSVASLVVTSNLPIRVPLYSVNQRLPSGPVVTLYACEPGVMPVQTVRTNELAATGSSRLQLMTLFGPIVVVGHVVVV
jgi:hypothetical protein